MSGRRHLAPAFGLVLGLLLVLAPQAFHGQTGDTVSPAALPRPVPAPSIENLFQLGPDLYSGGEPTSDAAFAQLEALGIKTIVSVDGATPNLAAARRHGLRYVHLPLGYNGYSADACLRLAKAGDALPGPMYLHCHHGRHRGPAAAAILATTRLGWTSQQGERWLQTAGTSTNYPGLYATVRDWRRPTPEILAQVSADFAEVTRISTLAQAMVEIDRAWDRLKTVAAANFQTPANHPDLVPASEASRIAERLTEIARLPDAAGRGSRFVARADDGAARARQLAGAFAARESRPEQLRVRYEALASSCTDCHRAFRDPPAPAQP